MGVKSSAESNAKTHLFVKKLPGISCGDPADTECDASRTLVMDKGVKRMEKGETSRKRMEMEKPYRICSAVNSPKETGSAKKPTGQTQNFIEAFAVQCHKCLKWREVATEDEFEEFRSKPSKDPFVCKQFLEKSCDDPADLEYDASRTWVMDKPNIPKTPKGFKRRVVLRRDQSRTDVHYVTPDGTRIRTGPGMKTYLKEHPEYINVSPSDFCFISPKVRADTIPDHVERTKKLKRSC